MKKHTLILSLAFCSFLNTFGQSRYVGADVSLLPEYIAEGAKYKDQDGKPIEDLLDYLYDEGMRVMRVRLFVNPELFPGNQDPNACQDLAYITPLCQEIKDKGYKLMLDFHYSDTWADPSNQWIPSAWEGQTDEELTQTIYEYTSSSLKTLAENGVVPDFIQPGNEISYGFLWSRYGAPQSEQHKTFMGSSANWDRFGKLLNNAIKACREECPEAQIVIHTERTSQINVQKNFYDQMEKLGVDYDIIGISYYPYFHGNMNVLNTALQSLETNFPTKDIMIVETGYPYEWKVPGADSDSDYPYGLGSSAQNEFAKDLVKTLESHPKVTGLFWWWLEYNAYNTNLTGWYNAPLFDSRTGKATPALKTICSFGSAAALDCLAIPEEFDNDSWFNLKGQKVKKETKGEILIHGNKKIINR